MQELEPLLAEERGLEQLLHRLRRALQLGRERTKSRVTTRARRETASRGAPRVPPGARAHLVGFPVCEDDRPFPEGVDCGLRPAGDNGSGGFLAQGNEGGGPSGPWLQSSRACAPRAAGWGGGGVAGVSDGEVQLSGTHVGDEAFDQVSLPDHHSGAQDVVPAEDGPVSAGGGYDAREGVSARGGEAAVESARPVQPTTHLSRISSRLERCVSELMTSLRNMSRASVTSIMGTLASPPSSCVICKFAIHNHLRQGLAITWMKVGTGAMRCHRIEPRRSPGTQSSVPPLWLAQGKVPGGAVLLQGLIATMAWLCSLWARPELFELPLLDRTPSSSRLSRLRELLSHSSYHGSPSVWWVRERLGRPASWEIDINSLETGKGVGWSWRQVPTFPLENRNCFSGTFQGLQSARGS